MKSIYYVLVVSLMSCRTSNNKESSMESCPLVQSFGQKVTKVSFLDTNGIKAYNGTFIEIEGYFAYSFEDIALYSKRDPRTAVALWLDLKIPDSMASRLRGKEVQVVGRVDIARKGHDGGYWATLDSAFCIAELLRYGNKTNETGN